MKRVMIGFIAGVLVLGPAAGAYAQGAGTEANVNHGVNPSPGAMPEQTSKGTKEVNPATGAPMGGSHKPGRATNTRK